MDHLSRRQALQLMAVASASLAVPDVFALTPASDDGWHQGDLVHLLPLVNHRQMLIKASFGSPQSSQPHLHVDGRLIPGVKSDTRGRFWQFHVTELEPNRSYSLHMKDSAGETLTDSWPLKTFPAPDAPVEHLRILAYTCAGGNEEMGLADGTAAFLPMAIRQRLLERGLSFSPDVVIANGDHIYWDQATSQNKPAYFAEPAWRLFEQYGHLKRGKPALHRDNEAILTAIVDPQIAQLYGVRLRSTPVYMLTDDHDLFENDEASDELITLPPDRHMLDAARSTQYLYYPEFLPEATRSPWLAGSSAPDRAKGISEVYGTFRYGKLLEALLYDTKRYCTIKGPAATVIPPETEHWLRERTASEETDHLMHIPSTPLGWSAGKWGEWYPDVLQKDGRLGIERPKPYWPSGWWSQHQRILEMLHAQQRRSPLIVSGDLHALASGKIHKSGSLDFSENPIQSICVGPLGSAGPAFPSAIRGTPAQVPSQLVVDESVAPLEKNGFTLIDVTPQKITLRMFAWRPPEALEKIDSLEPFHVQEIARS